MDAGGIVNRTTGKSPVIDQRVTWAEACRDVVISAMDKGQLIPVGLFVFVLLMIFKMNAVDDAALANRLLDLIKNHSMVGYICWILTLGLWYVHARYMRMEHNEESGRIGREKSRLQEQVSGRSLPSSRRKRS
jgi:hypothetical protein